MRYRLGPPKAITATAHKLARIIYHLVSTGQAFDDSVLAQDEHQTRSRKTRRLEHDHLERCHQGIGNRLIDGVPESASGPVVRQERLGGILSHYYREAA